MNPAVPTISGMGEKSETERAGGRVHGGSCRKKGKKVTTEGKDDPIPRKARHT